MKQKLSALLIGLTLTVSVTVGAAGCAAENVALGETTVRQATTVDSVTTADAAATTQSEDTTPMSNTPASAADSGTDSASILSSVEGSFLDVTQLFTERDLEQSADLTDATRIVVTTGANVTIDTEGVYVLSGTASNVTVEVDAGDDAKVQLVLDGVSITNESSPAISVISADKVFVTLTGSENHLEVSGAYDPTDLDAVIFSKSDLVLNGTGSLEIASATGNGVTSKDDLTITGGTYSITSALDGIEANDSIRVYDGVLTFVSGKDALHSENNDDSSLGYVYIAKATLDITATDDGIQGNAIVQIDGGTIDIHTCAEGIEGTHVQINGGDINIYATDDGINAAAKSSYDVVLEINGGTIAIDMASGDTDGLDSNGDLYINGGTIDITANSPFDYMGTGALNGGQVTVNGTAVTQLTQSQMGHGGGGTKPGR